MALPEVTPGTRIRLPLPGRERPTGGAFQVWRGDELIHQGSEYGAPPPDPVPDEWRPVGLLQTVGDYAIFFYIPTNAPSGAYELRLATTIGSRSGSFVVRGA